MFVDSHCHLNFPELAADLPAVLGAMAANRVTHALCISVTLPELPAVLQLAADHANLYATVGVHPDTQDGAEPSAAELVALAARPKVVAIGETGGDPGARLLESRDAPAELDPLRAQHRPSGVEQDHLQLAAMDGELRPRQAGDAGGVMHCFTETWEMAAAAIELGFHISFSGIVTFKNAAALKEVARRVPLERMLIETDSPYLAPVPFRGKTNQPAYVRYVAEEIARLRDVAVDEIAAATSANFFRLFGVNAHAH